MHLSSRSRTSDILIIVLYYSQTLSVAMMSQLSYREGQIASKCAGTYRSINYSAYTPCAQLLVELSTRPPSAAVHMQVLRGHTIFDVTA